jgi:hypothetical protein
LLLGNFDYSGSPKAIGIYSENQVHKPCEWKFVVLASSIDYFMDMKVKGNQCGNSPFQTFNIIGLLNSS